jgi:phytoene synthase
VIASRRFTFPITMPDAPPTIAESYQHACRISRRSGSNFYRSFWLLPSEKRLAMCALYAFARITDDIGDCEAPISLRKEWLSWWRQATAMNLIGETPVGRCRLPQGFPESTADWPVDLRARAEEILPAVADAVSRFEIPSRFLLEIIDGVLADQTKTRFDTYELLEHYCYLVASAVGLACLHIWQFRPPLPMRAAVDCGLAFQLTNILRDIREDAQRGRIYLPQQHWREHGLCEDDLLDPRPDDRLRCLISDEARRAAALFDSGWRVWDSLHPDGRPMFSMMWRTYRRILSHIEADPCSVLRHRVRLSTSERLGLGSQHFIGPLFRRLPVPPLEVKR